MTIHTATYSPEDNKIRLYATERLDAETYAKVKAAGFAWAPQQKLFVAPRWTPAREDLAVALAGELQPEQMTMAERAAIKAERLDNLAHKRHRESNAFRERAESISERFAMGQPILMGHHSQRKAERDNEKMQAADKRAKKAHDAANYWLYRAEGVEAHANYKNDPRVRAGRIETLLAELRDVQRELNKAHLALELWGETENEKQTASLLSGNVNTDGICPFQVYLDFSSNRITASEAREKCVSHWRRILEGAHYRRVVDHILNRLAYERELLGPVARYSGEFTTVILQAFARQHGAHKPEAVKIDDDLWSLKSDAMLPLHLSASSYMELNADEWRDLMQSVGYEVPEPKERRKSGKPAPMPLVNPTQEQAERLQTIWNHDKAAWFQKNRMEPKTTKAHAILQETYTKNSGGSYSRFETIEIDATGRKVWASWKGKTSEPVARIRIYTGVESYAAYSVLIIKDKPQKPLPIDLDAIEAALTTAQEVSA